MIIREISKKSDVRAFVKFPIELYKDCKQYVPSLIFDEVNTLTKSPCLDYCKLRMWLAYNEKGEIVGRVAGIINPRANELFNQHRVRFGFIDFIDDFEVARALVTTVEQWGRQEGMTEIHGPLGYNTWCKQGMLIEGFENLAQFNCIYNYDYYPKFLEKLGYTKECDWVQYITKASQEVPEKVERINKLILQRYNLSVLDWKSKKDFAPYMEKFFDTYNESFSSVHNFIPLTRKEIEANIGFYLRFLVPPLNIFLVSPDNEVAGFAISLPSLSKAFQKTRGHIFPFGWYHIWKALHTYEDLDLMLNGVAPKWNGKGLSSIYHCRLNQNTNKLNMRWAITNPQIDTNTAVQVWKEYETKLYTRRRCFIKTL